QGRLRDSLLVLLRRGARNPRGQCQSQCTVYGMLGARILRSTFSSVRMVNAAASNSLSQASDKKLRPTRLSVIINAASGANDKEEIAARLIELFKSSGADARVELARDGAGLTEMARRAAREETEIVVAGGGDGTISAVASVLAGTDKIMGVLPLGTLNHFAKDLSIPLDLEEAV